MSIFLVLIPLMSLSKSSLIYRMSICDSCFLFDDYWDLLSLCFSIILPLPLKLFSLPSLSLYLSLYLSIIISLDEFLFDNPIADLSLSLFLTISSTCLYNSNIGKSVFSIINGLSFSWSTDVTWLWLMIYSKSCYSLI